MPRPWSATGRSCRGRSGAERVDRYLEHVEFLFSPDLFIVGGGVSRKADKWLEYVDIDTEIVVASLENEAGIVGAALIAEQAKMP